MNFFQNMQINFYSYHSPNARNRRYDTSSISHERTLPVAQTSTRNVDNISLSSLLFSMIQNEIDQSSSGSPLTDILLMTEIPLSGQSTITHQGINLNDINRNTELLVFDQETTENVCSICQHAFIERNIIRKINSCQHIFHTSCIDRWFNTHTTCPVCRSNVCQ